MGHRLSEKVIENAVCKHAEANGWWQCKLTSPGRKGVPDRMFIKKGVFIFLEMKRSNGIVTESQKLALEEMENHGANIHVCFGPEGGIKYLDQHDPDKQN